MTSLVDMHVRNLLCAVKQYAEHIGVDLDAKQEEAIMSLVFTVPEKIMWTDIMGFITLNNFDQDFLSFLKEFFNAYKGSG